MTTHSQGDGPIPVPGDHHLTTRLWERGAQPAGKEVLKYWQSDAWRGLTWPQLASRVRDVAAGLIANGVEPSDRVVIMSATRLEWTIADLAILSVGAVTVPIFETSAAEQCAWILTDSGAKVAFVGRPAQRERLESARGQGSVLEAIFVFDQDGLTEVAVGSDHHHRDEVDARVAAITGADIASLIYTSGTTGQPKGCVLTHGQMLSVTRQSVHRVDEMFSQGASTLLFLPLAHVLARVIQFGVLERDLELGYARSIEVLPQDLRSFAPTFVVAVPRVFDKVFTGARRKAKGTVASTAFRFAVGVSQRWAADADPGPLVNAQRKLADLLVYRRLRDGLGGRLEWGIAGGAGLPDHLAAFFRAAGITILEGYGLTETFAVAAVNTPQEYRLGTVGRPNLGTAFRITDDGELEISGPGVFSGYWQNPEATAQVLDDHGWFRTGDLASIDDDGFVRITGRRKEIIVTDAGKNVSPLQLEERLEQHELVGQAMVVGDDRPHIGALVTLDPDAFADYCRARGLSGSESELVDDPELRGVIGQAVAHANSVVSREESIRSFTILPRPFSEEDGELTPTLKLRRHVVAQRYADRIDGLYRR